MLRSETRETARILVVEDEAVIALDLKRRLEKLGYEVCGCADTGAEAIAIAVETEPNLILMDIIIEGSMDGVDAAAELVRHRDIPIVFLTAHTDAATIMRVKRIRPFGYLVKPFQERELDTTIQLARYRHRTA
jgi:CheY-like chemotaxis protein